MSVNNKQVLVNQIIWMGMSFGISIAISLLLPFPISLVQGNFYISETEYIAPASLHGKGEPVSQIIYTNVKEIVEHQQQYIFDSFWSRAISAERRIREIEEGIVQYETKVLENKEQIFSHLKSVIEKASERSVCSSIGGMQLVYDNFFDEYKKIIDRHRKRGEGKGVRLFQ